MTGPEIVPAHLVQPPEAILLERLNFIDVVNLTSNPFQLSEFLALYGLIANSKKCSNPRCQKKMVVRKRFLKKALSFEWICSRCGKSFTYLHDSFFYGCRLRLRDLIRLMYGWSMDWTNEQINKECGEHFSGETLSDWIGYCREVCAQYIEKNPVLVGGFTEDESGNIAPKEVEIHVFNRKPDKEQWVLGGVERGSGNSFFVRLKDKRKETIEKIIQEYILPGTRIISDKGAEFMNIELIGSEGLGRGMGIYIHHPLTQGCDTDPRIHINSLAGTWMQVKKKLRHPIDVSNDRFHLHLFEYLWRKKFKEVDKFSALLYCIRSIYWFNKQL